jgi:hypothetical protein
MLTLKFVGAPNEELLFEAPMVRRDGNKILYTNEHEVEIEMVDLEGRTVFVMNENGATVATYRF